MCQRPRFVSENAGETRFAVEAGELGDQWLLAAVASLALTPRFLDRIVPPDQGFDNSHSYCGVFRYVARRSSGLYQRKYLINLIKWLQERLHAALLRNTQRNIINNHFLLMIKCMKLSRSLRALICLTGFK
jgi:hypothetical protein